MTPNQLPPLSDERIDSIFADWLDAACLIYQEGSDTIEPAPQTHLHKNDVVQLMRVVESATLAALAQQSQEPWGWAIEDKNGVAQAIRPARKEFFGCIQATEPFTVEDVEKMGREWPGLAPHRIVKLYTSPSAPQPAPVDERDAEIAELRAEVFAWRQQCDRLTHQVICCGVAASHPDATLTTRGAYAGKWNSGQAEEVRKLRAERDALAALQSTAPQTKGQP